jgi:hypothetical protein
MREQLARDLLALGQTALALKAAEAVALLGPEGEAARDRLDPRPGRSPSWVLHAPEGTDLEQLLGAELMDYVIAGCDKEEQERFAGVVALALSRAERRLAEGAGLQVRGLPMLSRRSSGRRLLVAAACRASWMSKCWPACTVPRPKGMHASPLLPAHALLHTARSLFCNCQPWPCRPRCTWPPAAAHPAAHCGLRQPHCASAARTCAAYAPAALAGEGLCTTAPAQRGETGRALCATRAGQYRAGRLPTRLSACGSS